MGKATYSKAFGIVGKATRAEQDEDYIRAIELYLSAADMLQQLAAEERDTAQILQIKGKAKELQSRAERLKLWRIRTQEFEEKVAVPLQVRGRINSRSISL